MESSACSCDFDYDGVVSIHSDLLRTARKEHKCIECNEKIKPGEKYHYITQLYDGRWSSLKVCVPCELIRANFCAPYFMLREMIQDYLGFDYMDDLSEVEDDEK